MSIEIFLCYAREDEVLRQGLEKHLKVLKRQGLIDIWHDRNISAGADWGREIDNHLNVAQIILLLVSPDFMDSDYCYGVEMTRAMKRYEDGGAFVVPIILRPVYWQRAPFGKLQALPVDATPITNRFWHTLDDAFFNVAEGIRSMAEKLIEELANNAQEKFEHSLPPQESNLLETGELPDNVQAEEVSSIMIGTDPSIESTVTDGAEDNHLSYEERLTKGYQYQLMGVYDDAMQEYRVIISKAPELRDEVISNVRALVTLVPTFSLGYRVLGDAYMLKGEYLLAMETYTKALSTAKKARQEINNRRVTGY